MFESDTKNDTSCATQKTLKGDFSDIFKANISKRHESFKTNI